MSRNTINEDINEDEAELLIEEHLRDRGWKLTDFETTRKRWRKHLDGEEADRVFLYEGKIVAILEAKKPGKEEAKGKGRDREPATTSFIIVCTI